MCYNFRDICEAMTEKMNRDVTNFLLDLVGYTDAANCAQGEAGGCVMTAIGAIPYGKLKVLGPIGEAILDGTKAARAACSFSSDTKVLMADGTAKAIKDIKVGDKVLATDPETGEQGPRTVTHLWVHRDRLVALEFASGEVLTTTEDHPFWNDTDRQWQQAQDLDTGDMLHSSNGVSAVVTGLDWATADVGTAYNLTVDEIHTYYVLAGNTAVLVHNSSPACGAGLPDLTARSLADAETTLAGSGFTFASETAGGYRKYAHADGSEVWIRPNGEVIRLGPKVDRGPNTKNYRDRYGPDGLPTDTHSTGEVVIR